MRHGISGRQLGRSRPHYHSLMNNLVASLITHESIETTLPKAKELRPVIERLITKGRDGSLHDRRVAHQTVRSQEVLAKLFGEIGPRMKERQGGYTRIVKLGFRRSDAAPMARIELVDYTPKAKAPKAKPQVEEAE